MATKKEVKGKLLDRKSLLTKAEFKVEKVEFDDGTHVFVMEMSGQGRDRFEQSLIKEVKDGKKVTYERALTDFRAKLAVNTLSNEDGVLLLQPNDYGTLSRNMTAANLEKIVNAAQKLNAITDEDKDELVKNSEGDKVAK